MRCWTRALAATGAAAMAMMVAAAETPPFRSLDETRALPEEETRIWSEAGEFDLALQRQGHLLGDAALDDYLQSIVDKLYPELGKAIRVRAVSDPQLNAFALPNGSLYIHVGLIGRARNEAQLATVVAHEAAHFIHRHGLRQRQSVKGSAAFATVAGMIGGLPGLLGQLAALSSAFGYSQDLEREADLQGFERLRAAGYAVSESVKIFETLETESKLLEIKEPFMFSSHPRLRERIDSFASLVRQQGDANGYVGADAFLERTAGSRIAWLEAELARARFKSLIYHLGSEGAEKIYPAHFKYYLGEALRLRAGDSDAARAEAAYREALAAAPEFAPTYRALGLVLMKRGDNRQAHSLLSQYLQRAPAAPDAAYVRQYLRRLERAEGEKGS